MFHQPPACLDQPLLEARQGPVPNPLRQNQSPPQIPQVIGNDAQPKPHPLIMAYLGAALDFKEKRESNAARAV